MRPGSTTPIKLIIKNSEVILHKEIIIQILELEEMQVDQKKVSGQQIQDSNEETIMLAATCIVFANMGMNCELICVTRNTTKTQNILLKMEKK